MKTVGNSWALISLFVLGFCFGCKPKMETKPEAMVLKTNTEPKKSIINGSVFIVSKNAENHKLGMLGLSLFNVNEFNSFVTSRSNEVLKVQSSYKQLIDENNVKKESYSKTNVLLETGINNLENAADAYYKLWRQHISFEENTKQWRQYSDNAMKLREKRSEYADKLVELSKESLSLYDKYPDAIADIYIDCPLKRIAYTETDADGKFSFSLNENVSDVVLLARGQRKILEETEHYKWLLKVNVKDYSERPLLLSNQNMLGGGNSSDAAVGITVKHFEDYLRANKSD